MRDHLPRPLLAALGAAGELRHLPGLVLSSPLRALTAWDEARSAYDTLAARGEALIARSLGVADSPDPDRLAEVSDSPDLDRLSVVAVSDLPDGDLPEDAARESTRFAPRALGPEPIDGYDTMTLGALRGHLRTLPAQDLDRVLAYERSHLARGPVLTLLEHRAAKLAAE